MDYGLIVDVETTGVDPESDRIIEIGLIEFGVGEDWKPFITSMYGGLEDPGQVLSEEIKKLTGIDDHMLKDRQIDWDLVQSYFDRSVIYIAHNAAFDQAFLLKRLQGDRLTGRWACSLKHIDWPGHGFRTRALNYLAADQGFVNPFAHRAMFDCATTFRVIEPYFQELVTRSYLREFKIAAKGAPFEAKDKLKERRYRWDPEQKFWYKTILEDRLEEERQFLTSEIYTGRRPSFVEQELSPL